MPAPNRSSAPVGAHRDLGTPAATVYNAPGRYYYRPQDYRPQAPTYPSAQGDEASPFESLRALSYEGWCHNNFPQNLAASSGGRYCASNYTNNIPGGVYTEFSDAPGCVYNNPMNVPGYNNWAHSDITICPAENNSNTFDHLCWGAVHNSSTGVLLQSDIIVANEPAGGGDINNVNNDAQELHEYDFPGSGSLFPGGDGRPIFVPGVAAQRGGPSTCGGENGMKEVPTATATCESNILTPPPNEGTAPSETTSSLRKAPRVSPPPGLPHPGAAKQSASAFDFGPLRRAVWRHAGKDSKQERTLNYPTFKQDCMTFLRFLLAQEPLHCDWRPGINTADSNSLLERFKLNCTNLPLFMGKSIRRKNEIFKIKFWRNSFSKF